MREGRGAPLTPFGEIMAVTFAADVRSFIKSDSRH